MNKYSIRNIPLQFCFLVNLHTIRPFRCHYNRFIRLSVLVKRTFLSIVVTYSPHGFVSERQVVHAALTRRTRPEALEDDVRDPLRG